jgi:lysophospholipase L1-like esterase
VAGAEIIVVYGNSAGFEPDVSPNFETCIEGGFDPSQEWQPPVVPSVEEWQAYGDVLDQIWAEIWALREGQPTILRTHDFWNPFIAPWREAGIEPECTANWEVLSQVIRKAAGANGVGVAAVFDVFNGPEHDEDPREKGWIDEDGAHPSDEGRAVVADALAAVGFEVSEPPR